MKKNLIYYSVGVKDEYAEMLKISLETLDNTNPGYPDVLILTDKDYYDRNFVTYKRPNTSVFLLPKVENLDQACFNKLRIFDYIISEYENIIYLDSDTIVNVNLNDLFSKCEQDGKLYTVVEDYRIENHWRIQFSLGTYTYDDLEFFKLNNLYTFNCGTFMFKASFLMKKHFSNVLSLIETHVGEYFTDQSFSNYYFNTYKLSDCTKIVKDVDYLYIIDSNFNEIIDYRGKILHVITELNSSISKIDKMRELRNRVTGGKNYENRNLWIEDIKKYIARGKGVEIGVFKGDFSKDILNNWEGTLYLVDIWKPVQGDYYDYTNNINHPNTIQETINNVEVFGDRAVMIRASSKIASDMFQDESLDFIYIDANHSYDFIVEDINLWFPKLKKGGIFSGHDYILMDWYNDPNFLENKKDKYIYINSVDREPFYAGVFGVNPAVDEFCEKMGYKVNHTDEWFSTWWIIK